MSQNRWFFICLISLILLLQSCYPKKELKKKNYHEELHNFLKSSDHRKRRHALRRIKEDRFVQYAPQLQDIIYNSSDEGDRYLASSALAEVYRTRVMKDIEYMLDNNDPILRNCGLIILEYLLKKKYSFPNQHDLENKVYVILLNAKSEIAIQKASSCLGLFRYDPAYNHLIDLIQSKKGLYDEVITSLALLGNAKRNPIIIKVLYSLISEIRDKRLIRSIRKAVYIINNDNQNSPIFENEIMDRLSDIGSNHFKSSFNGESYFRLYDQFNPKEIEKIKIYRIPLLKLALKDPNPKIKFKSAKLLGQIGDETCCQPLLNFYNENKENNAYRKMALESLAKLNCNIAEKLILSSKDNSPIKIYFIGRKLDSIDKNDLEQYPLIFSQKELFPKEISQIQYLLGHKNNLVRVQAVYSLYQSKVENKWSILKKRLELEQEDQIKDLIQELLSRENIKTLIKKNRN